MDCIDMDRKYSILMKYNEHCFKVQTKLFFMTIKSFALLYLFNLVFMLF